MRASFFDTNRIFLKWRRALVVESASKQKNQKTGFLDGKGWLYAD